MSTKRARYIGTEDRRVTWPPGEVYPDYDVIVEPKHWLPDDAPAKLRDDLLKRDDWSEVDQAEAPKSPKASDKPADSAGPLEETK